MNKLTQAEVKRLFDYRDGVLYWKVKRGRNVLEGYEAGTTDDKGYRRTKINGKSYRNHQIVFLYHNGYIPKYAVDHIDGDRLNNRIENLRENIQTKFIKKDVRINNDSMYDLIKKSFDYRDGVLYWKVRNSHKAPIGLPAGTVNKGYLQTRINGKIYFNHRLIYAYHHGYMPEGMIDHIDKNPSNNNIENLREVVAQCNQRNRKQNKDNTSGVKGVYWRINEKIWMSVISINYKQKHLGMYHDFVDAVAARLAGEQCVNWNGCDSCSPAYLYMKNYLSAGQFLLDNYVQLEENKI